MHVISFRKWMETYPKKAQDVKTQGLTLRHSICFMVLGLRSSLFLTIDLLTRRLGVRCLRLEVLCRVGKWYQYRSQLIMLNPIQCSKSPAHALFTSRTNIAGFHALWSSGGTKQIGRPCNQTLRSMSFPVRNSKDKVHAHDAAVW